MRNTRQTSSKRRGFTLLELVVVVLVLGIVASVAAPKMFGNLEQARENSTHQSLSIVRDALERYKAEVESYPPGDDLALELKPYISGQFPENQISGEVNDASVSVKTGTGLLTADGATAWMYNKDTGEFIINSTDAAWNTL